LFIVSHHALKNLAALVWYVGGIVLLIKGGSLLLEAELLQPDKHWPWTAAIVALLIGGIKAKFVFSKSCRKNLDRIAALDQVKIWQFFRPVFFLFLLLMILIGGALSTLGHRLQTDSVFEYRSSGLCYRIGNWRVYSGTLTACQPAPVAIYRHI